MKDWHNLYSYCTVHFTNSNYLSKCRLVYPSVFWFGLGEQKPKWKSLLLFFFCHALMNNGVIGLDNMFCS